MKMQKSKRIRGKGRHAVRMTAVLGAAFVLIWSDPMVSRAEPTGTVKPSSVNIRKEPSQDSEVIGSTTGGKEISIRGKVDVSGVTWYQVYVQGDTLGYVRADMVEQKGDEAIPTVSAPSADGGQETSSEGAGEQDAAQAGESEPSASGGAQVQAQEEMEKQYASIKVASAKVRPDPSTSNNPVESIPSGTQVVVSGKSEGTDSKTWYYVTFTGANGSEKTGYVRSDLLELGDMLPVEEEAPPEEETPVEDEPVEEPAPSSDYELGMETNDEGEQVLYIYDHVMNRQQPLVPLLEASYANALGNDEDTGSIVKQRIVIVALAVLLAVAVIAIIVMAFKLRDAYYEDYEDDEEDEDEEEDSSDRRSARRERENNGEERQPRRKSADEEESRPRKRGEDEEERRPRKRGEDEEERRPRRREDAEPASRTKSDRTDRRRREVSYEEEPDAKETVKPAKGRKAKNFLLDDDEFEFEFLNMDDKDLK